jgi:hypothetical protein
MTRAGWRHRRAAGLIGALVVLGGAGACTAPPGQDLQIGVGPYGSWGPTGPAGVGWKAVGPEPVTGPTTVTLTVLSGPMVLTGALYTDVDRDYTNTGYEVAPDGRSLTLQFDGTTAVDRNRFFKFNYGNLTGSGTLRATITNANDGNPANDSAETTYEPGPPFVTTTAAP